MTSPTDSNPGSRASLGAELVIPLLALAFAGYFFYSIYDLAWEARATGELVGIVLVLLVLAQLVRIGLRIARGHGRIGFAALVEPRDAFRKRVILVTLAAAFIPAIDWMGLTLAVYLAMLLALYLMGVRKRRPLVWVPVIVAAFAYGMFVVALDADIPHGPIERLLGLIF